MVLTPSTMAPLGSACPEFELKDPDGKVYRLSDFAGAKGLLVMFICNHCPYVKHIQKELARFAREVQERGIAVVAINSNDFTQEKYAEDRPEKMKEVAERLGYTFPYLIDETQEVAKAFTAACTPDFFLYAPDGKGGWRLVYRGQFDASRPDNGIPVTGEDLRRACEDVLAGRDPDPEAQRPSMGCNIKWKPGNEPPYFG